MQYDVIIVGAGPAGLATGYFTLLFSNNMKLNLSVIMIDKDHVPGKNKPCGGMICYPALKLFPELRYLGDRIIAGIGIVYRSKNYDIMFNEPIAVNMDRAKLAKFILEKFSSLGGNFLGGVIVKKIKIHEHGVEILSNKGTIQGKVLVGADGFNSLVRSQLFQTQIKWDMLGVAYQESISLSENIINDLFDNHNFFYYGREFSPAGYAWIFPHRDHVRVGVGAIASRVVGQNLERYMRRLKKLNGIADKKILKKEGYIVPLSGGLKKLVTNRCLLVGDSAHQVSPLSGAGIHYSMLAGLLAGKILVQSVLKNDFSEKALKKYEALWNRMFRFKLKLERFLVDLLLSKRFKIKKNRTFNYEQLRVFAEVLVGKKDSKDLLISYIMNKIRKF